MLLNSFAKSRQYGAHRGPIKPCGKHRCLDKATDYRTIIISSSIIIITFIIGIHINVIMFTTIISVIISININSTTQYDSTNIRVPLSS